MELLIPAVIDPLLGTVIDKKYRLLAVSGRGRATSRALQGHLHESIGRTVAVKVVDAPQDAASTKSVERLRREARALSLVNHPNLPRLFDAGELSDGSTYLVLDFTEGYSLLSRIAEDQFIPAEELIPIIGQICDALEHLHAHGMIHRDVKPENILLLTRPLGRTTVKLIDFGICKFDDSVPEEGSQVSIEFAGSPLYMSPEHVNGLLVDRRSDIYSLGATIYHALCGKPPLSETNLIDIIHAHRSVMPSPISYVAPQANVPLAVEAAVFRALQKLPGNRYQTAAEMKAALLKSLTPETYTGRMSHLEFSGAELRALAAFVKAGALDDVNSSAGSWALHQYFPSKPACYRKFVRPCIKSNLCNLRPVNCWLSCRWNTPSWARKVHQNSTNGSNVALKQTNTRIERASYFSLANRLRALASSANFSEPTLG